MSIKNIITQTLQANFSEFTEDQAAAVIEAIKANGFVLIKSPITDEMQKAGKEATGIGMFGYDMQDALDAMIEAQEQKITELKVEWACDCFECGHHEAIIYSTASEAGSKGWFHDGDAVKCCKCGHTGEVDARGEDSDICWNEEPAND